MAVRKRWARRTQIQERGKLRDLRSMGILHIGPRRSIPSGLFDS